MKERRYLLLGVLVVAAVWVLCSVLPPRARGRMPKVALGPSHLVVVKADGSLWALGRNSQGPGFFKPAITEAVGDGTTNDQHRLVRLGTKSDWADVAAGNNFTLALKSDGSLWAWGWNNSGQLGDSSQTNRNRPVRIGQDRDWVQIAAGAEHSLALKTDGTLWAWGRNNAGQLGLGTMDASGGGFAGPPALNAPARVGSDKDWKAIAAGDNYSLALKTNGTLWMCGGHLPRHAGERGPSEGYLTRVGVACDWVKIFGWDWLSAAIKADGTLWMWGVGVGTEPHKIGDSQDWTMAAVDVENLLAVRRDGTLWALGASAFTRRGDGTTNDTRVPERIGNENDWVWASIRGGTSVALKADGSLWLQGKSFIVGESKAPAWLRDAVRKYHIPIRLPPPNPTYLVPVKLADLGAFGNGNSERKAAKAGVKVPSP